MRTELRPQPHSMLPGETVVELWHDGRFIGQVTSADGPGVKIFTKYPFDVIRGGDAQIAVMIDE